MAEIFAQLSIGTLGVAADSASQGRHIAAEFSRLASDLLPSCSGHPQQARGGRLTIVRGPGESAAEAAARAVRTHLTETAHG